MDVEILARVQFALTIMFHYIYPPLSIGLGLILVIMEAIYLKTRNPFYLSMTKFWVKVFALTFAIGVATGIVMEFEFGTNWATYSRYVGDVFGSALAAEGVFAFFLESGFLALLLFGWDRIGPKLHFFSTLMVCLGAHFSAIWIVVANSWMQTPAGYHIVGEGIHARAEITDFWAMVFNPSSMDRLVHVILGAWLSAAFLVISISAYYLLTNRFRDFALSSMKIAWYVATISVLLQAISGDRSGKIVAEHQPLKLAAIEGLFKTTEGAPEVIFGIPNKETQKIDYAIEIPNLLSFLSFGDFNAKVTGLEQFPKKDWPNIPLSFFSFRLMILMWSLMLLTCIVVGWRLYLGKFSVHRWCLRLAVASVLFPQIANQAGWVTAEVGRYPWIVYNHLRISEGLSKAVSAEQVFWSLVMFTVLYFMLFVLFLFLLNEKIQHGPSFDHNDSTYKHLHDYVKEISDGTTATS